MIDYRRAGLEHLAVHFAGNKGNGEEIKLSKKEFKFRDESLKDLLMHYFLSPFKSEVYFHLKKGSKGIFSLVDEIFRDKKSLVANSKELAKNLYDQSVHPKVKGGEFYVVYFNDMTVDGELCDAIGLFKSENRETFLKVFEQETEFDIDQEKGININKLDKGALIFKTEKDKGYKVCMVDTNSRSPEIALYWQEDFLHLVPREDAFFHTQNFIAAAKGFCEEVLTEENNVPKAQQMAVLNKSVGFFKERDNFNMKDFKKEVMPQAEVFKEFNEYRKNYIEENHLTDIEDFEVSQTAFKKNAKYMRSVIKLDKNFHVYVHSKHEFIEKGFDEERGMKYYKLYFENEE
jgi:hypothetical protein